MSGAVRVLVPGKINLYLGVGPRREDGYHELTTVYSAISLYDEITATAGGEDGAPGSLTIDGEGAGSLPLDRGNLAVRAAESLAALIGADPRVRLRLRKRIPVAGGLAGGSADAAATLVACDGLWDGGLPLAKLASLAADLGSDVPFLLYGGTAVGTGRGEVIEPVPGGGQTRHWAVAVASGGLSTPAVYAELDRLRAAGLVPPADPAPERAADRLLSA
ncbi:MAG: 4-(cytidine 5'-diphospho)-2-C-methyl-D-erythritol kinase, partial [Dactylosporangium sp.]|nr:4-(cytidine 5'-diphospho)-2-C-methyl-D-erythritol kinase [Dactylosporangium sp.]NNJ61697.1 4-(cytidine 5'-diphospho)-2-C-methyl-D-erythritol kinase [Dactylosporangium sp.]